MFSKKLFYLISPLSLLASDIDELSLEALMNTEVTSVSKSKESMFSAASAIYVLSNEEIKRKGAENIAEALRGVPGVQVNRRTTNSWEVSIRGFDNLYSNKLLVLIDGRTVYTPVYSGTYWNFTNYPTEDIERIEIIRGPGAALWGSNAVNGVINITTKKAKDQQGGVAKVEYGEDFYSGYLRYGGTLDEENKISLSSYLHYHNFDELDRTEKTKTLSNGDDWDQYQTGMSLDYQVTDKDLLRVSGDYYKNNQGNYNGLLFNNFYEDGETEGYNLLTEYQKTISARENFKALFYYDYYNYNQDITLDSKVHTWNGEVQYKFMPNDSHEITLGAGFRLYRSKIKDDLNQLVMLPETDNVYNYNFFIQDKIYLVPELWTLTIGSKFEENDYTGFEYQPSVRLAFTPNKRHTIWAAVSRAVRTPNRYEHNSTLFGNAAQGNHDVESENVTAYELGYRVLVNEKLSFDLATFYNDYSDIMVTDTRPAIDPIVNDADVDSYGFELSSNYFVSQDWQLKMAYSYFKLDYNAKSYTDELLPLQNVSSENQLSVHSFWNVTDSVEFDISSYYNDNKNMDTNQRNNPNVPDYLRTDARLSWQVNSTCEVYFIGKNIFNNSTLETLYANEVQRSFYAGLTYQF